MWECSVHSWLEEGDHLHYLFLSPLLGVHAQQLDQSPQSLSIKEGEAISMNCTSSSTLNSLLWYKQDLGQGPVLLIALYKMGELTRSGKLTAQFSETRKQSYLTISASQLEHAGTYFCAGFAQCSTSTCSLYSNS